MIEQSCLARNRERRDTSGLSGTVGNVGIRRERREIVAEIRQIPTFPIAHREWNQISLSLSPNFQKRTSRARASGIVGKCP